MSLKSGVRSLRSRLSLLNLTLLLVPNLEQLILHYVDHLLGICYDDLLFGAEHGAICLNYTHSALSVVVLLVVVTLIEGVIHEEAVIDHSKDDLLCFLLLEEIAKLFLLIQQLMHRLRILCGT